MYCVGYASGIIKREVDQGSQDSDSLQCSGVPSTTLKFNKLLEGVTELRKVIILMVVIFYTKRTWAKLSQEQGTPGNTPELAGVSFHLSPPYGVVWIVHISPETTFENIYGALPMREAHPSFGFQGFHWDWGMCTWVTTCIADLSLKLLQRLSW